jgi:hypothetical protein
MIIDSIIIIIIVNIINCSYYCSYYRCQLMVAQRSFFLCNEEQGVVIESVIDLHLRRGKLYQDKRQVHMVIFLLVNIVVVFIFFCIPAHCSELCLSSLGL